MKRNVLFLVISLLMCSSIYGQTTYKDLFKRALEAKDMGKAEDILKKWDLANANDAELYVSYFNFFTIKSQQEGLLHSSSYDSEYSQKALDYITEGIERFPTRFDMRVAKIYMLNELDDYASSSAEVMKLIVYSDKIQNNWKGEDFLLVDEPVEMFYGAVQDQQELLYSKEEPAFVKEMVRISEEMLKYYPKHIQSMLNMSTGYLKLQEVDKSLDILQKATAIDPDDPIILYNLAFVYEIKGDGNNAKKYYELTIKNTNERGKDLKTIAKKRLDALT